MNARPTVAVVGMGGLGCPAVASIASSGFAGTLRLFDEDRVERSNLHRQTLYSAGDLGELKVVSAQRVLRAFGPDLVVDARPEHLDPERAEEQLRGVDVVVEGTDNLAVKFLASDVARALGVPVVHGACVGWGGTVLPVAPGRSACYRCVFEGLPDDDEAPTCAVAGVYGPVTAVVGAVMAADALRLLAGDLSTAGSVARYDGWSQGFRATRFERRPHCPCAAQ